MWLVATVLDNAVLDVATMSQKDHKLFSATFILCCKNLQLKDRPIPKFLKRVKKCHANRYNLNSNEPTS